MTRPTTADLLSQASAATLRRNPGLFAPLAMATTGQTPNPVESPAKGIVSDARYGGTGLCEHLTVAATCPVCRDDAPYGRCPHTGRAYRSKTEARWAAGHPDHRYEALAIVTPCGTYWPDFVAPWMDGCGADVILEIKGGFIRDRAMHKVKAAIRPALALGFAGIWLAQWKGGKWTVEEVREG